MAQMGRPPLGDDKMVAVSIRLPKQLLEQYRQAGRPNILMREALQNFMLTYDPERDKHS
jgi:uncharacterized protein (DUF4415 family)